MKVIDMLKSKLQNRYQEYRKDARTGYFVRDGKPAQVQLLLKVQLQMLKAFLLSIAVIVQPVLMALSQSVPAPKTLQELFLGYGWVSVIFMALILATMLSVLLLAPTQEIPDDDEYKRFMKVEARVFVTMSVGLQMFNWLQLYWPLSGKAISLTGVFCWMAGLTMLVCALGMALCIVAIKVWEVGTVIYRLFHKESANVQASPCDYAVEAAQTVLPDDGERIESNDQPETPQVGHLRIIGPAPTSGAMDETTQDEI